MSLQAASGSRWVVRSRPSTMHMARILQIPRNLTKALPVKASMQVTVSGIIRLCFSWVQLIVAMSRFLLTLHGLSLPLVLGLRTAH